MQEKKIKFTDVLFVGLAFFASYFGAGNLISRRCWACKAAATGSAA